ncbi:MAG: GNAT family N-acetyltransferase [Marinomonas atlantica]|nr:GNAT family N-acetyltransferase [Marinomonas atlantica]
MSSDLALNIDLVSKTYHLYDSPQDRLKQMLFRGRRQYYREYQALKPLTFSLPKGEVLGVVGRNGAGKSTLLQLICGTLTPTAGQVQVQGRIAALLELGAGFNPQFTGRENIYLSASIMGIERNEVEAKIDDIIDFAGVRNFIDQPVSTYSSGMYVRLAFSVATTIEPDILIIDEALSVGDGDFARRSFERIMAMKERGATILFCSHSLYQIEVLCSQAIWLEKGQLIKTGEPTKIVSEYQAFLDVLSSNPEATPADVLAPKTARNPRIEKPTTGEYARLKKVTARTPDAQGDRLELVSGQTDLTLDISFLSTLKNQLPQIAVVMHNAAGQLISSCGAWTDGTQPTVNSEGEGQVSITFPQLPLLKGIYYVGVLVFDQTGVFLHDEADPVVTLDVSQPNQERGLVMLPHSWKITTKEARLKADASVSKRQPSDRWQVRSAKPNDLNAIKQVFFEAFGQPLDEDIWHWKYRHANSPGYVVLEGDDIVAFCGGAPRQGLVQGQPTTFCQIGDVMVNNRSRGVLTKTGPFYRCVYPFMGEQIGEGRAETFAFGFPNHRHLRVGQRQKLYAKFDHILEATWAPQAGPYHFTRWHGDAEQGAIIDQHWQAMQPHVQQHLIGLHDQAWLRFRYLDKPNDDYQILLVTNQQGESLGVIVLKDRVEANYVELLDFISTPDSAPQLIAAAQQIAHQQQREKLYAWLTPNVYRWLEQTNGNTAKTDIVIPGNGLDNLQHTAIAIDNWWLLGGDSDFR